MSGYKVLVAHGPDLLQQQVNGHMASGWVPIGGIAAWGWGGSSSFAQAMVQPTASFAAASMFPAQYPHEEPKT